MEYNTDREGVTLMEYGRNIHKLVAHIKTVEDREKRSSYAETVVQLMKQINPNVKDSTDYNQKVWDDLFIISDFDLDVDSPFPIPNAEILDRKPDRVLYKSNEIRYKHYGRNLEIMISQAIEMEDPETREGAVISIGRLMKSFAQTWNGDNLEDKIVLDHIKRLSGGKLDIDLEKVMEYKLFDSKVKNERPQKHDSGGGGSNNQRRKKGGRNKKRRN
ncbi:MAG: DUF4290 domain-containing protein [Bacteroidota bacterium]